MKGGDISKAASTTPDQAANIVTLISPESVEQKDFSIVTHPPLVTASQDTTILTEVADKGSSTERETLSEALRKSTLDDSSVSSSVDGDSTTNPSLRCGIENEIKYVPGLFVFGGMDTSGHIHSDCFILCPSFS